MLITRKIEIDLGHRVPNHKSKCRNLHGHRYVVEVGVDDKVIKTMGASDEGMVIDFGELKQIMMEEIDEKFDHGFVMYSEDEFAFMFKELSKGYYATPDGKWTKQLVDDSKSINTNQKIIFVPFIPTAENLAKFWYGLIKPKLLAKNIKIKYVRVWETPNCSAMYEEVR